MLGSRRRVVATRHSLTYVAAVQRADRYVAAVPDLNHVMYPGRARSAQLWKGHLRCP